MSNSRKRNNNRNIAIRPTVTNTDNLRPSAEKLKAWIDEYHACYDWFMQMVLDADGIVRTENNKEHFHPDTDKLEDKLCILAKDCNEVFYTLNKNKIFCPDTFIIYIKIILLCGLFAQSTNDINKTIEIYMEVNAKMQDHINQINYENDIEFQQVMEYYIDIFQVEPANSQEDEKSLRNVFIKKCGINSSALSLRYQELVHQYTIPINKNNEDDQLTLLKNKRDSLLSLGRMLKLKYESLIKEDDRADEYKIYLLSIYFVMCTVSELSHTSAIIQVSQKNNRSTFSFSHDPDIKVLENYFKYWSILKKLYIEPAVELIKSMTVDQSDLKLYFKFNFRLESWLSSFLLTTEFFNHMIEKWINQLESSVTMKGDFTSGIKKYLFAMSNEKKFLITSIILINKLLEPSKHLVHDQFKSRSENLLENISQLENRLNLLKEDISRIEQEKIKLASKNAIELINEEEVLYRQKIRKYILRTKTRISMDDDYATIDEQNEDESYEVETSILINPSLVELEQQDEVCFKRANNLLINVNNLNKLLKQRSKYTIPFPSFHQKAIYQKISSLLVEYYYLAAEYEKHVSLSKRNDIKQMDDLQHGIEESQNILKQSMSSIQNGIDEMLALIDGTIAKQQISREAKIRQCGKDFCAAEGITNASDEDILKYGGYIFKQIGIQKTIDNKELSEFTKQDEFLELMQFSLTGFKHLQDKINNLFRQPLCHLNLFVENNKKTMQAQFSLGGFEGLIGLFLRQQHDSCGNISYLQAALSHFQKANKFFAQTNDHTSMAECHWQLAVIKDKLADEKPNDYFQESLDHYKELVKLYPDDKRIEFVRKRIKEIEPMAYRVSM